MFAKFEAPDTMHWAEVVNTTDPGDEYESSVEKRKRRIHNQEPWGVWQHSKKLPKPPTFAELKQLVMRLSAGEAGTEADDYYRTRQDAFRSL